uniref:Uncharacterized protein n=1 Tax=Arundo donax TaxID=35708 RepID=A0A0A9EH34_ARUDO
MCQKIYHHKTRAAASRPATARTRS